VQIKPALYSGFLIGRWWDRHQSSYRKVERKVSIVVMVDADYNGNHSETLPTLNFANYSVGNVFHYKS
jgi:hypothetical protein